MQNPNLELLSFLLFTLQKDNLQCPHLIGALLVDDPLHCCQSYFGETSLNLQGNVIEMNEQASCFHAMLVSLGQSLVNGLFHCPPFIALLTVFSET